MSLRSELRPCVLAVYQRYRAGGKAYKQWIKPYKNNVDALLHDAEQILNGLTQSPYECVLTPPRTAITWEEDEQKHTLGNAVKCTNQRPVLLLAPPMHLAQNCVLQRIEREVELVSGSVFQALEQVLGAKKEDSLLHPFRTDIRKAAVRLGRIRRQNPRTYFLKSDITKFYPSVHLDTLDQKLRRLGVKSDTIKMYRTLVDQKINIPDHFSDVHKQDCAQFSLGLPLGLVISPHLANLYILEVDRKFSGTSYVRYVDDVLFWGDSKDEVKASWTQYRAEIEAINLKFHELGTKKTKIIEPNESLAFLGLTISHCGRATPMPDKLLIFEYRLRQIAEEDISLVKKLIKMEGLAVGFTGYYGLLLGGPELRKLDSIFTRIIRKVVTEAGFTTRSKSNQELHE